LLRALQAAGMGVSFLPVRGILGSAYLTVNSRFKVIPDPFTGENLVAVQALAPEVTLVHAAQGDSRGNILIPRVSDWRLAITASRRVIATVEERVDGVLKDQPEWQLVPAIFLTALVHCPGGAAPTGYPGYYPQDAAHLAHYLESSRDATTFGGYLQDYVFGSQS
jgi:glutaconate CoA-transferase, subunit A